MTRLGRSWEFQGEHDYRRPEFGNQLKQYTSEFQKILG